MGDRMQEGVKPRRPRVHPPSLCVARVHFRRTILLTCWVRGTTSSTSRRKRARAHQIGEQKQTNTERGTLWGYCCPAPHHCCLRGLSVAGVLELTASLSPGQVERIYQPEEAKFEPHRWFRSNVRPTIRSKGRFMTLMRCGFEALGFRVWIS